MMVWSMEPPGLAGSRRSCKCKQGRNKRLVPVSGPACDVGGVDGRQKGGGMTAASRRKEEERRLLQQHQRRPGDQITGAKQSAGPSRAGPPLR